MIWFLTCVPGLLTFLFSVRMVRFTQERLLTKIIALGKSTLFGKDNNLYKISSANNYQDIKIRNYEDFEPYIKKILGGKSEILTIEAINLLEPTSGSTSATKFIPYTDTLKKEFQTAINPWIASLYINYPSLFWGSFYWAISPNTSQSYKQAENSPPIGFEDDTAYLNPLQQWISNTLFPVPSEVRKISDQQTWEYCTLLFLMRCRNLRSISVWHPSFLIILMENVKKHLPFLIEDIQNGSINPNYKIEDLLYNELLKYNKPNPVRAAELSKLNTKTDNFFEKIWPKLCFISCWADGQARHTIPMLRKMFPNVVIQPKGLIATEGIVSIPLGKRNRCVTAVSSHFFEFIDKTDGSVKRLWELEDNKEYNIILTTGGGLYRYCLNDIVRVEGFFAKTPCLSFISRDGFVSDLVGEKINIYHVAKILNNLEKQMIIRFEFFMIAPIISKTTQGYALFLKPNIGINYDYQKILKFVEEKLKENFHYLHARNISQLNNLRIFLISSNKPDQNYIDFYVKLGIKRGDIKQSILEKRPGWENIFEGNFVD